MSTRSKTGFAVCVMCTKDGMFLCLPFLLLLVFVLNDIYYFARKLKKEIKARKNPAIATVFLALFFCSVNDNNVAEAVVWVAREGNFLSLYISRERG